MWQPQVGPQLAAIEATWCDEMLYGGARGGGKSDFLLGDYLQDVDNYQNNWRGVLFRRTMPELEEIIARSMELFPATGATYSVQKKTWTWPHGAFLRLRYLERQTDASRYQGHSYTWIGFDELTQWPDDTAYKMLKACLRSPGHVPTKRIRCSANPGGPGHHWCKDRFIDFAPNGYKVKEDEDMGTSIMFIPSRVQDNKILLQNDPNYVERLKGVGSPELVKAWLDGDWSVITGAFFPEWATDRHVIRPFKIPEHWLRIRGFDWGSASPFAVLWAAVSDGCLLEDGRQYPKGSLIYYREWYGASKPGVGLKMRMEDVAAGILARQTAKEKIGYSVADPAMFKTDGGPSMAETFKLSGVVFRPADNQRIPGWAQLRGRLIGQDDQPMVYFFDTCRHSIRSIPALQHDEKKPEDLDTDSDDHCGDVVRYIGMSRPYTRPAPAKEQPDKPTFNQILASHDRKKRTKTGRRRI